MYHDGWREHLDYEAGAASEAYNCLTEARMKVAELNAEADKNIKPHLEAGRFVVVGNSTYYCRSTDAAAGETRHYESDHATAKAAEGVAESLNEEFHESDYYFSVMYPAGEEPIPVAEPVPAVVDDDVPF